MDDLWSQFLHGFRLELSVVEKSQGLFYVTDMKIPFVGIASLSEMRTT